MISKHDLERLMAREDGTDGVLSLFLDMSVNSDNKRTYQVFLNQRKAEFGELESVREGRHTEALSELFERMEEWLRDEFDEENRGVVFYAEIGGDWFEALQFPVPVQNAMVIGKRPMIGPLAQVIESYHHHGVIMIDREHVRLLSVHLGTLLDEIEVRGEPLPSAHDIQAGGYSQSRYQQRKREETRSFFRDFAKEIEEFDRRYQPDDFLLLGTEETVAQFREFLPDGILDKIVYTGPMRVDEAATEVLQRLEPHLHQIRVRDSREAADRVIDRARQGYMATAGFQATLGALQEGRVDTLVIAPDANGIEGVRCTSCGYAFAIPIQRCPFDDAPTSDGVNIAEEAIRLAEQQDAEIEFVDSGALSEIRGIGALLRY